MGGYLVKFQQTAGGVNVVNGGLGFLMTANKEIRMVMGSTFRSPSVNVSTGANAPRLRPRARRLTSLVMQRHCRVDLSKRSSRRLTHCNRKLRRSCAPQNSMSFQLLMATSWHGTLSVFRAIRLGCL